MSRFKVGDRVKLAVDCRANSAGSTAKIVDIHERYFCPYQIKFDEPISGDDGLWWAHEDHLAPASPVIPDGWTTADEPPKGPHDARNVEIMLQGGKRGYGWHGIISGWQVFSDDADVERIKSTYDYAVDSCAAAPGEVICWREIQPERLRVGQRVRVRETTSWYESGDTGTIGGFARGGDLPVYVRFDFGEFYFCAVNNLEPLPDETKPEPEPEEDAPYYVEYVVMDAEEQVRSCAHDHKTIMGLAEADARNGKVAVYKKVAEITRGPLVVKMF